MKIKIKNTKDIYQKAVIFGYYDDCYELSKQNNNPFFNLKTDEGIEIEMNGDKSIKGRLEIVKNQVDGYSKPIFIDSVEFKSSIDKGLFFDVLAIDANGSKSFNTVFLNLKKYNGWYTGSAHERYELKCIDCNTSWLFNLAPLEEISINIKQK